MLTRNKWDETEIEKVKQRLLQGISIKEIATELNRSYGSVKSCISNYELWEYKINKNKKWEDSEIKVLIESYYSYLPSKIISKKLGRTINSIHGMTKILNLKRASQDIWSNQEIKVLQDLYPQYSISHQEILSKLNNKNWNQVKLKANKLKLKRPRKQYNTISNYFENITTIEQAYILGFIAADGCIRSNDHGIHIGVHKKDVSLLSWIISKICPDYQIKYSTTKTTNKNMSIFEISDNKMNLDLQKYNMIPQKTTNLHWPELLPEELEMPFILGYFDGDGSLAFKRYAANNKIDWSWEICGAQLLFLKTVKNKIYKHTGIDACGPTLKKGRESFYRITLSGEKIYKLDEYITQYDIGLKRKRIKYFWEFHEKPLYFSKNTV